MANETTALGAFLRARRTLLQPDDVGLITVGARRVPGLRREEVAELAGLSAAYYARLERGEDRRPSALVLDALATALRLDEQTRAHLHRLAEGAARPPGATARSVDGVTPALQRLFDAWHDRPAIVIGRYRDVLAATELATLVNPGFVVGTNLLRWAYLTDAARDVYVDWEQAASEGVAGLRASAGTDPADPDLVALVDELSAGSEAFRRAWLRHDAREPAEGVKRYRTRQGGPITLDYVTFTVNAAPDQTLYAFSARPGSEDERTLRRLRQEADGPRTSRAHPAPK